jgi:hypothetical protein
MTPRQAALPLLCFLLFGCPKNEGAAQRSGAAKAPTASVSFQVFEAGNGKDLPALVWPEGDPEHSEVLTGGAAASELEYAGIGRTADGFALEFLPGRTVTLMFYSPDHELGRHEFKVTRGHNDVIVELKAAKVDDDRLPALIKEAAQTNLPNTIMR